MIQIGKHKISSLDIFDPEIDKVLQGEVAKVFYVDPPWGDASTKYWVTMNRKMTGHSFKPQSFEKFVDRLIELAQRHTDGHVMIENGVQWGDMIADKMSRVFHNVTTYPLVYSSKDLKSLIVVATTDELNAPAKEPKKKKGVGLPRELIGSVAYAGDTVIDVCCGMGYTAQACIDHNLRFIGNEFNTARLAKTVAKLRK